MVIEQLKKDRVGREKVFFPAPSIFVVKSRWVLYKFCQLRTDFIRLSKSMKLTKLGPPGGGGVNTDIGNIWREVSNVV